jgi:2-oxoglutarate/2-oxoacid ferredoxin oxidoreductase subunit alpha
MSNIVIAIAGDSGDGVQLFGNSLTDQVALKNLDFRTLPDFPAEIRAPAGTVHGVSGYQIQFGPSEVFTAGQYADVLIAFNVAGFKKNYSFLKPSGILLYDPAGFDSKNYKLAQVEPELFEAFKQEKLAVEFTKLTTQSLENTSLSSKEKDKNKNIFALGLVTFALGNPLEKTLESFIAPFPSKTKEIFQEVFRSGYYYGETIEFSLLKYSTNTEKKIPSILPQKNITGNKALANAILALPRIFCRDVVFAGYPITPASDILHELAKYDLEEVKAYQSEDEIAAVSIALGASFGGAIGITASSGPGIDLKQEAIGLGYMAEMPLLIIDIQRAGPSTGMPTKIEQSDLALAIHGRHGDAILPVVAIATPATAFDTLVDAVDKMIAFQTPVFLLSDAMIANGSQLWTIPAILSKIKLDNAENLAPYKRNALGVRPWTALGQEGVSYMAGGLEKDYTSGGISYDGENHQKMTHTRYAKLENMRKFLKPLALEAGSKSNGVLVISWGSTYGASREAVLALLDEGKSLAHLHLEWIVPLPENFEEIILPFDKIIIPELNQGQLADYLASKTNKKIERINKVQGLPFYKEELMASLTTFIY